jgi:Cu/Ag efflux pump CusA
MISGVRLLTKLLTRQINKVLSKVMSLLNYVSSAALRQAAVIKEKIEALQSEFANALNSTTLSISVTTAPVAKSDKKKRGMSAAAKKKIAAAQKIRWAKFHAARNSVKPAKAVKAAPVKPAAKKGGISAAGRAKIAAAAKARWAKVRAAKAKAAKK